MNPRIYKSSGFIPYTRPLHHITSHYILTFENVFFLQRKHPFANRPLIDWIALRIMVQQKKSRKSAKKSSIVPLRSSYSQTLKFSESIRCLREHYWCFDVFFNLYLFFYFIVNTLFECYKQADRFFNLYLVFVFTIKTLFYFPSSCRTFLQGALLEC